MKQTKLYLLKCVAKKECVYPHITVEPGDTFYFSPNAASREMSDVWHVNPYRCICPGHSLPFVRNEKHAKTWQVERYASKIKRIIESEGEFDVEVITLTIQYEIIK